MKENDVVAVKPMGIYVYFLCSRRVSLGGNMQHSRREMRKERTGPIVPNFFFSRNKKVDLIDHSRM